MGVRVHPLSPAQVEGIVEERMASSRIPSPLCVFGHSFAAGVGATGKGKRWTDLVAAELGVELRNRAIGGAALQFDSQGTRPGGYANVLQELRYQGLTAPYVPGIGIGALHYGFNDLREVATFVPFKSALRTAISRMLAASSGVFEESHASMVETGTWAGAANAYDRSSGDAAVFSSTNGDSFTVSVPSDFPGGVVAVQGWVPEGSSATITWTVDGGAAGTTDLAPIEAELLTGRECGWVKRFTGLAAGAHTIVGTISAAAGLGLVMDSWWIEAPDAPLVLVLNTCRLPDAQYGAFTGAVNDPITDAKVNGLNAAIGEVVTEFNNPSVVLVDADGATAKADANFIAGHPSDLGMIEIAQAVLGAIDAHEFSEDSRLLRGHGIFGWPVMGSQAALPQPPDAPIVRVTGATGITSIGASYPGHRITFVFTSGLTVTDGGNLKLAGNFTATGTAPADDTLTLICDGTNWIEIARAGV